MANGDDYDPWNPQTYAPTQEEPPYNPYPPGTTGTLRLDENDPLRQWAQNMTPEQFQGFAAKHAQGDPEGAIQHLVDSGVPPPEHHYDSQGQPFYPTDAFGNTGLSSGGEVRTGLNPVGQTREQAVAAALQQAQGGQAPRAPSLGVAAQPDQNAPEYKPPLPTTRTTPGIQPGPVGPGGGPIGVGPPTGPLAPIVQNAPTPEEARKRLGGAFEKFGRGQAAAPAPSPLDTEVNPNPVVGTPQPRPRPQAAGPRKTTIERPDGTTITYEGPKEAPAEGQVPTPKSRPKDLGKSRLQQGLEAGEDASKSFAGVKAPPRPVLPNIGAPGVRSPVGLHPSVQGLLGLAGQVSPQQLRLMQLLGKAV
jgi:hypothetical protein